MELGTEDRLDQAIKNISLANNIKFFDRLTVEDFCKYIAPNTIAKINCAGQTVGLFDGTKLTVQMAKYKYMRVLNISIDPNIHTGCLVIELKDHINQDDL